MLKLDMRRTLNSLLFVFALLLILLAAARPAAAVEVKISASALERTLVTQLFNGPDGRYYLRGNPHSSCYVYADSPHVSFADDRIVVDVHTRSRLGASVMGRCLGVSLSTNARVSLVPDAEEESIGFRDARIEHMSESRELNFLLVPFLSGKLPAQMKVNAADLVRQVLARSKEVTGYSCTLGTLKMHSLLVEGDALVMDADGDLNVD
ncbi:hypothetical protein GCM10011507_24080 [Edaphobacter acidisoli]|uniref:Uncharacterized protein n=1 Tax=Edaphobacter acidisoli TaxID=2040573 RepID=A0A916W6B0_9BACT|nr:hypothetical protein [Edaphobacter acidisoli]GGA71658.1 hypothetical protein GCM10011507_24080 [Edaphobacter acidisoli]